jgi:hypothetical protein
MMPTTDHDPMAGWADADASAFDLAIEGATALLQAVGARDFPDGVVVIGRQLAPGILGMSWGTGHRLAVANGDTSGRRAVLLDPLQTFRHYACVGIEVVALHELAHALFAGDDITDDQAAAAPTIDPAETVNALGAAEAHHPGWAAAFAVYARRAIRLRPWADTLIEGTLNYDLGKYGYPDAGEILEALGPVDDDEHLGPLLDPKSSRLQGLRDAMPLDDERAAVIATRGHYQVQAPAAAERPEADAGGALPPAGDTMAT